MAGGIQTLTEKEKQTLRLLVSGYDAKSMARHLGLSVHTVNERLRDARRKMATSSSREAARLLREVEAQDPELLGDKHLGDASRDAAVEQPFHQTESSGKLRRAGWIIGGFAMSLSLGFYALASLTGGTELAKPAPAASAAETAAVGSARQWLGLLDSGDWAASWDATGQTFKSLNTSAKWAEVSQKVRMPLGAMRSRELATVNFAPAPPHGYWIVKFKTSYVNKADAIETVSLVWEDGGWKVVGVFIE
jgi:DNA-binding CsgD family transcriptional regulator